MTVSFSNVSRRGFIATASAAGSLACAPALALADQAPAAEVADAPAWLGAAPEVAEGDIVETLDCDVLVVGAGTSGLFAACSAAENGAKVLVIEKNEVSPGIRGTLGAIGTKYQLADNTDIKALNICREMTTYAASNVNPRLLRLWADESAETIEWYGDLCEKAGREFMYCSDHDLDEYADQMEYRHWATGHACVKDGRTTEDGEVLEAYAADNGVEFRYNCPMVKLEQDESGRVTGVIAQGTDGYVRINAAKGVCVCTGGYALNDEMLTALQPETKLIFSYNSGIAGSEGDGIKACIWAGAAFDDIHTSMLFDRCPLPPDALAGGEMVNGMVWMASQPWLKVNLKGERFCNESAPYDFVLHASIDQPGHTYATIWDSNFQDYIMQFKTQGCSRMFPFVNGAPVSAIDMDACMGMLEGMKQAGFIQQADTVEELAEKLGIPLTHLQPLSSVTTLTPPLAKIPTLVRRPSVCRLWTRLRSSACATPVTCSAPWTASKLTRPCAPSTPTATPSRACTFAATTPVASSLTPIPIRSPAWPLAARRRLPAAPVALPQRASKSR